MLILTMLLMSGPAGCGPVAAKAQARPEAPARARPLNEMPDARPVLTVYREVDGCPVLLVRRAGRIVEEPVQAVSASILRR